MSRYDTFVRILDKICSEAPSRNRRYHPAVSDKDALDQARSRAFIHLYLKVKFGLLDFETRERHITDGDGDGGIDAYYIDRANKRVHVLQSKFRTNEKNFEEKEISYDEIMKIDVDRIVRGETKSEDGIDYNGKIRGFQRAIESTEFHSQFRYSIVVLANIKSDLLLRKLYKDYDIVLFDFMKTYVELCFPVCAGTYFTADNLHIHINLENTSGSSARVSYLAKAFEVETDVTIIFAPTMEIGRIMSKYRNSILIYNPRSFLGLKENPVNSDIERSINKVEGNEFALLNNGITIIADEMGYSDKTGRKSSASLELKNPQVINGGQTAFTLCKIYDDCTDTEVRDKIFKGKEVLIKIITIDRSSVANDKWLHIVEKISEATNFQTPVNEGDRRSNEEIQKNLQEVFYKRYGLFYERKIGEFYDGKSSGYISKDKVVERDVLLRIVLALDYQISETRANVAKFFEGQVFKRLSLDSKNVDRYAFAYACYQEVEKLLTESRRKPSSDPYFENRYGVALRYGRFAVVGIAGNVYNPKNEEQPKAVTLDVLSKWAAFETEVKNKPENSRYFTGEKASGWVGYFKGETINSDIKEFWGSKQ